MSENEDADMLDYVDDSEIEVGDLLKDATVPGSYPQGPPDALPDAPETTERRTRRPRTEGDNRGLGSKVQAVAGPSQRQIDKVGFLRN